MVYIISSEEYRNVGEKNCRDFLIKRLILECSLKVGQGSQFIPNSTRGAAMNYIFITYYKGQFLGEESRSLYW